MSVDIEIISQGGQTERHSFDNWPVTVGSSFGCDLIVPGAPDLWFSCLIDASGRLVVTEPGRASAPGQKRGRAVMQHEGLTARIAVSRPNAGLSIAWGFFRSPVPLPGLARLSAWRPTLNLGAGIALIVLVAVLVIGFDNVRARTLRPTGPITTAAHPHNDIDGVANRLRRSLLNLGIVSGVSIERQGGGITVSGVLSSAEAATVRSLAPAGVLGGVPVENAVQVRDPAPALSIRTYGISPAFVVLADGRRLVPGDGVGSGWVLVGVGPQTVKLSRSGQVQDVKF